jgi:hypothetical protein
MASVHLKFSAPAREDLILLRIFEAPTAAGPFDVPIEEVDLAAEGAVYPDYISEYTTDLAVSTTNYFTVQFEDDKGALTDMSNPVQGGTGTFVGEIMDLVKERDHTLDEQTVRQEAEFAIETYFGIDPYTVVSATTSYRIRIGLARLVQARTMINRFAQVAGASASSWTAGLVSMKSSTGSSDQALVKWLLEQAAEGLGLNYSRIAQMATMVIAGGLSAHQLGYAEAVLVAVE